MILIFSPRSVNTTVTMRPRIAPIDKNRSSPWCAAQECHLPWVFKNLHGISEVDPVLFGVGNALVLVPFEFDK